MFQQGQRSTPCGPARAQHQNAHPLQRTAQIDLKIPHQTHAVEVFRVHRVAIELHGVDRAGQLSALGQVLRVGKSVELKRRSDIQAPRACRAKSVHRRLELAQWSLDQRVEHVLCGLPGKCGVNLGRFAVADRVANSGVHVWHGGGLRCVRLDEGFV